MKQIYLNILVALCAIAGMTDTALAESKTVTYTITSEPVSGYTNRYTFTFVRSGNSFGYSNGQKTVTIPDITTSTGFHVELDDGLGLQLNLSQAGLTFGTYDGRTGIRVNYGGSQKDNLTLGSSHYYVTHVKMADLSGNALTGTANPWISTSGLLDKDVDMVTDNDALGALNAFSATFAGAQTFGQLTVTYGDPREYAITFNDLEGLSNPNPASYNVTTSAFLITAPSRTGYTLGTVTYTDALHTTATPVNLSQTPISIQRGDAVQRKAIAFNASWTAHHYTVHYDANGGEGSMDDQALTYDEGALAANAFTAPTDYVFNGWNTEDDGSGTAYTDQQAAPNVSPDDGATVTLYAQWRPVAGSCGDNARWSYDDDGTLSITGTGGTYNFSSGNRPWEQYKNAITTVSIGDGITSIGYSAFYQCTNLANITGGSGLIFVTSNAFYDTQWCNTAANNNKVNYIGRIAYIGTGVSGDVTLADGTIAIADDAFRDNWTITSVTIPATVTSIGNNAFLSCYTLATVNLLAATPPSLGYKAFCFDGPFYGSRTFNVRSADYKSAIGWPDIYNKMGYYNDYNDFTMRVVSTLALPDGVTASADADDKVTAYGTTYYAEGATVTLTGCSPDVIDYGSFTMGTRYVVSYNDGEARTDRYIPDANGQATFTMLAADVEVSTESYVSVDNEIAYIDADGTEQPCTDFTIVGSDYAFGESYGDATLGVNDGTERWYAVVGTVNVDKPLRIDGNAHIILCDGAALRVNADYSYGAAFYSSGYPLTIYGQAQGTGTLSVTNTGIAIVVLNDITINGGTVIATSTGEGIDIIGGGTLTINRGTVTATGVVGIYISQATLTQNGGTLTATGSGSSGINADGGSKVSTVNILGGTLTATGTDGAFGIRASYNAAVTLGWTNADDFIRADSYQGTVKIASGKSLYNGSEVISGTIDASDFDAKLNGMTLAPAIVLADAADNTTAIATAATACTGGKTLAVQLQGRTLYKDGAWNTLCLPFNVTIADSPLAGATVKELNATTSNLNNGTLTLNFSDNLTAIEAGTPYIVKWAKADGYDEADPETRDVKNPVFTGVTISGTEPTPVTFTGGSFVGQYSLFSIVANDAVLGENQGYLNEIIMLGSGNKLGYSQNPRTLHSFRAHFYVPANGGGQQARSFVLDFGEGEQTGILSTTNFTNFTNSAAAWYDMQGRKLNAQPTKKGLYIVNGKKIVVK